MAFNIREREMEQPKSNHMISVNSESGIYWQGDQVVRLPATIKSLIGKVTSQRKPESVPATLCGDKYSRSAEM